MSMDVFDKSPYNLPEDWDSKAVEVVSRRLPPEWIEKRESGGQTLSYIGGEKVIRLLNEAFQYRWNFEIMEAEIIHAAPKPMWKYVNRQKTAVLDDNGRQVMEAQPDIYQVKGRLTVPGFGIREQFGSKILVGGASEQESASKAAATDALKKCASLFGIGLELYDKKPEDSRFPNQQDLREERKPAPAAVAKPVESWDGKAGEIQRLKELKVVLGVVENAQLNPYVQDFLRNNSSTFDDIVPGNIAAFNQFLGKFAEAHA